MRANEMHAVLVLIALIILIASHGQQLTCRHEAAGSRNCNEWTLHASGRIVTEDLVAGDVIRSEIITRYEISIRQLPLQQFNFPPSSASQTWHFTSGTFPIFLGDRYISEATRGCSDAFISLTSQANNSDYHLPFALDACPPHLKFITVVIGYPLHEVETCCVGEEGCCDVIIESRVTTHRIPSTIKSHAEDVFADYEQYFIYLGEAPAVQLYSWSFKDQVRGAKKVPIQTVNHITREVFKVNQPSERERQRSLPQHRNEMPRYAILGAQKAGTTSLFSYICKHPMISCDVKEVDYFVSRFDQNLGDFKFSDFLMREDIETCFSSEGCSMEKLHNLNKITAAVAAHRMQYRAYFPGLANGDVTGEASPLYLLYGDLAIPRMRAVAPDMRLIALIREPTARAISTFRMMADDSLKMGYVLPPSRFGELIREEVALLNSMGITIDSTNDDFTQYLTVLRNSTNDPALPIVARGLYFFQLRLWLTHWPYDQLLVIPMSRIRMSKKQQSSEERLLERKQLQETMNSVYNYLGLSPFELTDDDAAVLHAGASSVDIAKDDIAFLNDFYAPFNEALYEMMQSRMLW